MEKNDCICIIYGVAPIPDAVPQGHLNLVTKHFILCEKQWK